MRFVRIAKGLNDMPATNMVFAKMGADVSRVSTFVIQFGFISSLTLLI
jgi:hypothetical protein